MKWLASLLLVGLWGCGIFAVPGRPCQKHEECDGLEHGYCSRSEICTRECRETEPCPDNSTCSAQGVRTVCLPKCEVNADCLPTFTCSGNVCVLRAPFEPPPG
jgi:hypothetical protein